MERSFERSTRELSTPRLVCLSVICSPACLSVSDISPHVPSTRLAIARRWRGPNSAWHLTVTLNATPEWPRGCITLMNVIRLIFTIDRYRLPSREDETASFHSDSVAVLVVSLEFSCSTWWLLLWPCVRHRVFSDQAGRHDAFLLFIGIVIAECYIVVSCANKRMYFDI